MRKIVLKTGKRKTRLCKRKLRQAIEKAYADILTLEIKKIKDPSKRSKALFKQMLKMQKIRKNSHK